MDLMVGLLTIYVFVLIGFIAKKRFYNTLHQESFVPIYIYFFMPILMVWGILSKPLNIELILIPTYFLLMLLVGTVISFWLSQRFLTHTKHQAIGTITGIIGNTGNMGIPIGLAIYGVESVPYTAMINLVNAIFVMTIGAYTYSRGTFSVKASIKNVLKLPIIWATGLAFIVQWNHIPIAAPLFSFLEIVAYVGIVIQLVIFGMFLATVSWRVFYPRIASIVLGSKFILLPLIALITIRLFDIKPFYAQLILLQTLVPIAVNNVNLASLYDCYPEKVAWVSFISFILAVGFIPIGLLFLK